MSADGAGAIFAMMTCAHGAEAAVKAEIADAGWRLAFSRPGCVTAKHNDASTRLPTGTFIRTTARSLGQARATAAEPMIDAIARASETVSRPLDHLHVWPKDRAPIGRFGFEPGVDAVSAAAAEVIHAALHPRVIRDDRPNRIAEPGGRVLDVVLIEPGHWFFGIHRASDWPSRWPGGVQPIAPVHEPVSRAYFKAAEAIQWSGFAMRAGDLAIEIGSAPGGACGRLLELGLRVIGIDPAEMDPRIATHKRFTHIRARGGDLPRKAYRGAKWLLVDSNVRPDKTLTTLGNLVTHRETRFAGLLMTLKIGDYQQRNRIDGWRDVIAGWGATSIRVRQLARNRREVCFAVGFG